MTERARTPARGPSWIKTPYDLPNSLSRIIESVRTLCTPSASQNRFWAKGRSADTVMIRASGCFLAKSLKCFVMMLQVPVSRLGTVAMIFRFPLYCCKVWSLRSLSVRRKSGAFICRAGKLPTVLTDFPFNVTVAIELSFLSPSTITCHKTF